MKKRMIYTNGQLCNRVLDDNCRKDDGKSFSYGGKPLIQTYKI